VYLVGCVDVRVVDFCDFLFLAELSELAKGDLVEPPAVDGVALPEHRLDELVLPSPIEHHTRSPASKDLPRL